MISIRQFYLAAAVTLLALPAAATDFCAKPPVVDGSFSETEWAGAERYPFGVRTPEGDVVEAEIWITNDTEQVYVAIRHRYTTLLASSSGVEFDANHSGQLDMGDDELVANWSLFGGSSGADNFRGLVTCPTCSYADTDHGGTNDFIVAASIENQWHVTELSHPFTGNDVRDLRASGGQYVAMRFFHRVFNMNNEIGDTTYPESCPRSIHYRLRDCFSQR